MPLDATSPIASPHAENDGDRETRLRFLRLDAAAAARLRQIKPTIIQALPKVADRFYRFFGQEPSLAELLGREDQVARLREAQAEHWRHLFDGDFNSDYFARAACIGTVHSRIGLEPRWYTAGYCLTLESLIETLVAKHGAKPALSQDIAVVLRAAFLDMDLALSTYQQKDEVERVHNEMNSLADVLERELQSAIGEISLQTERLAEGADGLSSIANEMRGMTQHMHAAINTTSSTVGTVASASQQLEASSRDITARMERAANVSSDTVAAADSAGQFMTELSSSVDQINGVVRLVQSIAQQTKLLALNATIEAARAGSAGRGFAVVASEVKELARQTEDAIGTVNSQARDILRATGSASHSVANIATQIRGVSDIATDVAGSASQQREATAEIARSVELAAEQTGTVAARAAELADRAALTEQTASMFHELAGRVRTNVNEMVNRMVIVLRSSDAGNRRREPREPVSVKFRLAAQGFSAEGWTADLSPSGALLVTQGPESLAGTDGQLQLDAMGDISVRIVAVSPIGIHVCFRKLPANAQSRICARIASEQEANQPYIALAQKTAAALTAAFEGALGRGRVSRAALFDCMYRPIEGTDPQQVLTQGTAICDELVPPIIEPIKASDPSIAFCAPCDRNGYIATHNRAYSAPQRPGEREWNTANCRNRRLFDDRTGLLAARSTKAVLVQAYPRDMGGGNRVLLKEFDAPIIVAGIRWGALRLAVSL